MKLITLVGLIIGGALGWIAAGEVADLPPLLIGHAPTVSLDNSQSSGGSSAFRGQHALLHS